MGGQLVFPIDNALLAFFTIITLLPEPFWLFVSTFTAVPLLLSFLQFIAGWGDD